MSAKRKHAAQKNTENDRPSLFRQVMGAVIGASLALALYYGYEFSSPVVTAWLTVPQPTDTIANGSADVADIDVAPDKSSRIASRTRQVLDQFGWHASAPEPLNEDTTPVEERRALRQAAMEEPQEETMEGDQTDEEFAPPERTPFDDSILTQDDEGEVLDEPRRLEPIAPEDIDDSDDWSGWEDSERIASTQAKELPSSGFGVWLAGSAALGITSGIRYARRKKKPAIQDGDMDDYPW